ncbi:MAG: hypothetical protein Q7J21_11860 [Rugosibacter sp.]|nr:hypothetical protein [Rugosibacter sp.]
MNNVTTTVRKASLKTVAVPGSKGFSDILFSGWNSTLATSLGHRKSPP